MEAEIFDQHRYIRVNLVPSLDVVPTEKGTNVSFYTTVVVVNFSQSI